MAAAAVADPAISRIDSHVASSPAVDRKQDPKETTKELKSKWPLVQRLTGPPTNDTFRLEGEIGDLVVLGQIPQEIDGTFYRIMVDPYEPPVEGNVPLDGDGNIHALRFKDGKVDFKTKYVETQRYLLERKAGKQLFGLYRNPWSHHPCVRAAVDSTANTNMLYWAGHLLAMKESALPYAVDPTTLETRGYDPYKSPGKAFTAHPKIDPFTEELVVHGYEAKGIATMDVVSYAISQEGKIKDTFWYKQPFANNKPGLIHDCVITKHWLMLFVWPFSADTERMKKGGHHWAYDYDRKFTIIVSARDPENPPPGSGWKKGEMRYYEWKNCMPIHTAGAWEEGNVVFAESSRVHDNAFPFFPADDGRLPAADAKADFVKWKIDISKPSGTYMDDPEILLDVPAEFPRIDERFMGRKYNIIWANAFMEKEDKNVYHGLNGIVMYDRRLGEAKAKWYYAGDDCSIQEPIFIPRHKDAEEGDGWVMALVERVKDKRSEVVVLDTKDFERPVAIVQMPFQVKAQIHGNWVPSEAMGGWKSLVREVKGFEMIKDGALEMLE